MTSCRYISVRCNNRPSVPRPAFLTRIIIVQFFCVCFLVADYKDSPVYRKPEWVSRMEVVRAQMLGNNNANLPAIRVISSDSERSMSLDSLTMHEILQKYHSLGDVSIGSDSVFVSECSSRRPSLRGASEFDVVVSDEFFSSQSDGVASGSIFAQSILTGYLQSHRQSIGAAIEAISNIVDDQADRTPVPSDDGGDGCDDGDDEDFMETLTDDDRSVTPVNEEPEAGESVPRLEVPRHLAFAAKLSPIQENGETPTSECGGGGGGGGGMTEPTVARLVHADPSVRSCTPDLISASSMEELKEFLMLETLCTSYQ